MKPCKIGGASGKISPYASVLKIELFAGEFNSQILLMDLKSDRVAGFHVAISEILLISYGVGSEKKGSLWWFESGSKISQISWLCANNV